MKRRVDIMSQKYKVKEGDTLSRIAQKICGDGSLWQKIYEDNKNVIGDNYNQIFPGQVLYVDCLPSGYIKYRVEAGDNLTKIANKICGNDNWQKIYEDNKDVIGDNYNQISPGQILIIKC